MQTQGEGPSTQIVVQPQVVYAQQGSGRPYAKYFVFQYWPAWAFVLGFIGFICVLAGLQSIVSDCNDSTGDVSTSCDIFETYIFFIFYLPNILIILVGIGIACGSHYNQTGWVLKCCLPCAMVALFIWAAIICYYLSLLQDAISIYCEGSYYDSDYICTDLKSSVSTAYAGQVLLLIYLIVVTGLGCVYACKASNANAGKGQAPLVVVQTTAPVGYQPQVYPQGYGQQQQPVVYQQQPVYQQQDQQFTR